MSVKVSDQCSEPADPVLRFPGSTLGEESMDIARSWLDTCLSKHKLCNADRTETSWYPTRLLKLERNFTGISVCVIETQATAPSGPFACLSHRWGQANPKRLTMANLEELKAQVMFENLSREFQDAFRACLDLNCYYLWIDSLCIIQDSHEDWLKEASQMASVYRNALFTISATSPRCREEGLSTHRHCELSDCLYRDIEFPSSNGITRPARITYRSLWSSLILKAPISSRGWVVQERLLSRRILHFASSQLAWECDELEACEVYPIGSLTDTDDNGVLARVRRRLLKPRTDVPDDRDVWLRGWARVVENYTLCALTKQSDKLIALSGVARFFQASINDDYIAGLWKATLIEELQWQTYGKGHRLPEYCAPSFCWPAIDGQIEAGFTQRWYGVLHADPSFGSAAVVVDVNTVLTDPNNPTGAVCSGSLTLKAQLVKVHWNPSELSTNVKLSIEKGDLLTPDHRLNEARIPVVSYSSYLSANSGFWPDDSEDLSEMVYCCTLQRRLNEKEDHQILVGILLHGIDAYSSDGDAPRTFRRVGYFQINNIDKSELLLDQSREATVTII
jgi:hypothetical protein